MSTAEPSGFLSTQLCGTPESWLSNLTSNAVPAGASSAVTSKPLMAAPVGAVTVSSVAPPDAPAVSLAAGVLDALAVAVGFADGSSDAVGDPDASSDGAGVTDGAGAYVQPGAAGAAQAAITAAIETIARANDRRRMFGGTSRGSALGCAGT